MTRWVFSVAFLQSSIVLLQTGKKNNRKSSLASTTKHCILQFSNPFYVKSSNLYGFGKTHTNTLSLIAFLSNAICSIFVVITIRHSKLRKNVNNKKIVKKVKYVEYICSPNTLAWKALMQEIKSYRNTRSQLYLFNISKIEWCISNPWQRAKYKRLNDCLTTRKKIAQAKNKVEEKICFEQNNYIISKERKVSLQFNQNWGYDVTSMGQPFQTDVEKKTEKTPILKMK